MSLKQPVTQKRLTNVAIVKLKLHGKRFEIACYKNKVVNWRDGIEKDLEEVIQTNTIFENVSKGIFAAEKDLVKVFGTKDRDEICRRILKTGELQVSDKEREVHMEGLFRDIVQIVVERCVHAQNGRQHTALTVENALRNLGFSVQPDHTAKKQSLKAIDLLCTEMPDSFVRAKMRLRITCPEKLVSEVREHLTAECGAEVEEGGSEAGSGSCAVVFLIDPRQYRVLDSYVTQKHAGTGMALQIITSAVYGEGADVLASTGLSTVAPARSGAGPDAAPAAATPVTGQPAPASRQPTTGGYVANVESQAAAVQPPAKKGMRCSACATEFEDASQYRSHCRSEWHNFNLKRKVKSLAPVTEEEFLEISLDEREGLRGGG